MALSQTNEGASGESKLLDWLKANKLQKYAQQFEEEDIDIDELAGLENDNEINDFADNFNMNAFYKKRFRTAINKLQGNINDKSVVVISEKEQLNREKLKKLSIKLINTNKNIQNKIKEIDNKSLKCQEKVNEYFNLLFDQLKKRQNEILNEINGYKIKEMNEWKNKKKSIKLLRDKVDKQQKEFHEWIHKNKYKNSIDERRKDIENKTNLLINDKIYTEIVPQIDTLIAVPCPIDFKYDKNKNFAVMSSHAYFIYNFFFYFLFIYKFILNIKF